MKRLKGKRIVALLLCLCMIFTEFNSLISFAVMVDEPEIITAGICEHHPEHDDKCGYIEAVEGQPCSHLHDENCGYIESVEGDDCAHAHDENCYALECIHLHTEECYSEVAPLHGGEEPVEEDSYSCAHIHGDDCYVLICSHEHDDECGYTEAVEGQTCAHEHDDECGYVEAVEGQPCEYVCVLCGVTVAEWTWEDIYNVLKPASEYGIYDVDWVLDIPDVETEVLQVLLPDIISAVMSNGVEIALPIFWDFENPEDYVPPIEELEFAYEYLPVFEDINGELESIVSDEFIFGDSGFEPPVFGTLDEDPVYETENILTDGEQPFAEESEEVEDAEESFEFEYVPMDELIGSDFEYSDIFGETAPDEGTHEYLLYKAYLPEGFILGENARPLSVLVLKPEEAEVVITFDASLLSGSSATVIPDGGLDDVSLHFIIRHWHSSEVSSEDLSYQDGSEESGGRHFVIAEGYILPEDKDDLSKGYEFYFVNQSTGKWELIDSAEASKYIDSINTSTGTIVLRANPVLGKDGEEKETFSGFSVSAGQDAVSFNNDTIKITYDSYIHLVKGHVFYISNSMDVFGTAKPTVFGTGGITDGDPEKDTTWVYIYTEDIIDNGVVIHTKNSIVEENGKAFKKGDQLPESMQDLVDSGKVALAKVYSTTEGLHTDKTASVASDDGRTYNIDLEAWYTEGHGSQVGMVLDASGSMAFASDTPTAINVYNALGIAKDENTNTYYDSNGFEIAEGHALYELVQKIGALDNYASDADVDWDKVFLDDELYYLLDPNKTDNSQLSSSDYSYFVYDSSASTSEYVALGYWAGTQYLYPQVDKLIGYYPFTDSDKLKNVITGKYAELVPQSGSSAIGTSPISGGRLVIKKESTTAGVKLDAVPSGDSFTIAFTIQRDGNDTVSSGKQNMADILYVGNPTFTGDYLRIVREGLIDYTKRTTGPFGSVRRAWLTGYQGDPVAEQSGVWLDYENDTVSAMSVFNNGNISYVVYVFENGTIKSYFCDNTSVRDNLNSTVVSGATPMIASPFENSITLPANPEFIFNAFNDDYNSSDLCIDNVFVYDTALNANEVAQWYKSIKASKGVYDRESTPQSKKAGSNATSSVDIATYIGDDGKTHILGQLTNKSYEPGWYYATYAGHWAGAYVNDDLLTAKNLVGIPSDAEIPFTDSITLPENDSNPNNAGLTEGGTGRKYTPEKSSSVRFYIDNKGYLRCFFSRSDNKEASILTSYVYELSDLEYIKVEALQRALGAFVTELEEQSPTSKVSAVRFSTSNPSVDNNLDMLVLLDWTSDATESAGILALLRGENEGGVGVTGGSTSYTISNRSKTTGIRQYNYGLTGGTSTWRGLKAFNENLLPYDDDEAKKFLIIFTDGKDTGSSESGQADTATKLANTLKASPNDYTIITVMLNGGPVQEDGTDYETAYDFLVGLSGNKDTATTEEKSKYFFSTAKGRRELLQKAEAGDYKMTVEEVKAMNDADVLTEVFTESILSLITTTLKEYTVKDYIDPRFDLISHVGVKDPNGKVVESDDEYLFHLRADGTVVVVDGNDNAYAYYYLTSGTWQPTRSESENWVEPKGSVSNSYLTLFLSDKTDDDAREVRLRYDSVKEMYYLEWVNQIIPGGAVGAEKLAVWNAQITVKAKDDFLGGNAVVTNGNQANMNWVYYSGDTDKSSGTDDMYKTPASGTVGDAGYVAEDKYPSKGFPRTTVNVDLLPLDIGKYEQIIYLGESIDPRELLDDLGDSVTNLYYWKEYLERYAKAFESDSEAAKYFKSLGYKSFENYEALLKELLENTNVTELSLPYVYLSDADGINQAGLKDQQQQDIIGELLYKWERLDPADGSQIIDGGYITKSDGTPDSGDYGPYQAKEYETLDTRTVQYKLTVTYYPYPDPNNLDAPKIRLKGFNLLALLRLNEYLKNREYEHSQKNKHLSDLQNQLDDLKRIDESTLTDDEKVQHAAKILALENEIAALQVELNILAAEIQNLKDEKTVLENALKEVGIEDFDQALEDLQTLYDNIYTVSANLVPMSFYLQRLEDELRNLQADKKGLEADKKAKKAELDKAKEELEAALAAQADTTQIEERIANLEAEIQNLDVFIEAYKEQINDLNTEIADAKSRIKAKETELEGLLEELKANGLETEDFKYDNLGKKFYDLLVDIENLEDYIEWCKKTRNNSTTDTTANSNRRTTENSELITEAYYKNPKEAVGDPQLNRTINGTHTTYVVRGELAFEMTFDFADLDYMFMYGKWKDKAVDEDITYTVNVTREYSENDKDLSEWSPTILPLCFSLTKADFSGDGDSNTPSLQDRAKADAQKQVDELEEAGKNIPDELTGSVILYYIEEDVGNEVSAQYPRLVADYEYDSKKKEIKLTTVTFFSDPRVFDPYYPDPDSTTGGTLYGSNNNYTRQLPIGTYTLELPDDPDINADWDSFEIELDYAPQGDYERQDGHFTDYPNYLSGFEYPSDANAIDSVYYIPITWDYVRDKDGKIQYYTDGTPMIRTIDYPNYYGTEASDTEVVFKLGTDTTKDTYGNVTRDYLTQRVGMAKAKASLKQWYELPATGGSGTKKLMLLGILLLGFAAALYTCLELRKRRT